MDCKGKVILEDTKNYESEPMDIFEREDDIMHGDEVSHHIQIPVKEVDTTKMGTNLESI